MAGPRVTFGGGRLRPFVHVIGGVVRSKASISVFDVEISESSTDFGGAAGGGFDLGFGERWALRLAADYRVVERRRRDDRRPPLLRRRRLSVRRALITVSAAPDLCG